MDNFNSDSTIFAFESKINSKFPFKEKGRCLLKEIKTKK